MFSVPIREGLPQLIGVFACKMHSMGIPIEWESSQTHVRIHADMGISNLLKQTLEYCYEETHVFNHEGLCHVSGLYTRPTLAQGDAILNMYHKWQFRIKRRNTF